MVWRFVFLPILWHIPDTMIISHDPPSGNGQHREYEIDSQNVLIMKLVFRKFTFSEIRIERILCTQNDKIHLLSSTKIYFKYIYAELEVLDSRLSLHLVKASTESQCSKFWYYSYHQSCSAIPYSLAPGLTSNVWHPTLNFDVCINLPLLHYTAVGRLWSVVIKKRTQLLAVQH